MRNSRALTVEVELPNEGHELLVVEIGGQDSLELQNLRGTTRRKEDAKQGGGGGRFRVSRRPDQLASLGSLTLPSRGQRVNYASSRYHTASIANLSSNDQFINFLIY